MGILSHIRRMDTKLHLPGEVWKDSPRNENIMVSNMGRVWIKPYKGYKTKPTYGYADTSATKRADCGFRRHMLYKRKTYRIHILVCEAFHGPKPFPGAIVIHLDEEPSNNAESNLRWGTRKENQNFPKVLESFKNRLGDRSSWSIHFERKQANPSYKSRSGKN